MQIKNIKRSWSYSKKYDFQDLYIQCYFTVDCFLLEGVIISQMLSGTEWNPLKDSIQA